MNWTYSHSWHIHTGDALETLATLPDSFAQCVVTSPPYYGLRDYGEAGQLGMEDKPDCGGAFTGQPCGACYVCHMVAVFGQVRRVLREDGLLFLNIGDSYASSTKGSGGPSKKQLSNAGSRYKTSQRYSSGVQEKNLLMIPARLALALQADGYYLRAEIIWHKPNPMPESVTDRPTKSHEMVYMLSKSARYFCDMESVKEDAQDAGRTATFGGAKARDNDSDPRNNGRVDSSRQWGKAITNGDKRNLRDVWTIATQPYSGAHFATMPPELVERCIKMGTKPGDVVLDPFAGAGTTLLVANRMGRRVVGIELNPEYVTLASRRIIDDAPLLHYAESAAD